MLTHFKFPCSYACFCIFYYHLRLIIQMVKLERSNCYSSLLLHMYIRYQSASMKQINLICNATTTAYVTKLLLTHSSVYSLRDTSLTCPNSAPTHNTNYTRHNTSLTRAHLTTLILTNHTTVTQRHTTLIHSNSPTFIPTNSIAYTHCHTLFTYTYSITPILMLGTIYSQGNIFLTYHI